MFVLQHNETGKYVACPGSERSYTNRLEQARVFRTPEGAEAERCVESETVVNVRHLLESLMAYAE